MRAHRIQYFQWEIWTKQNPTKNQEKKTPMVLNRNQTKYWKYWNLINKVVSGWQQEYLPK